MKASHVNSEGERISVETGDLHGEPIELLCIHDDPPPYGSGVAAPMLLDDSTREWLRSISQATEVDGVEWCAAHHGLINEDDSIRRCDMFDGDHDDDPPCDFRTLYHGPVRP